MSQHGHIKNRWSCGILRPREPDQAGDKPSRKLRFKSWTVHQSRALFWAGASAFERDQRPSGESRTHFLESHVDHRAPDYHAPGASGYLLAASACIAYTHCMQYTIRGIPPTLDNALRERARAAGKSLNETAVEALAEGAGMGGTRKRRRNLSDISGTWKADKAVEAALLAQDRVDKALWR